MTKSQIKTSVRLVKAGCRLLRQAEPCSGDIGRRVAWVKKAMQHKARVDAFTRQLKKSEL